MVSSDYRQYYTDWPVLFAHDIKLVGVINCFRDRHEGPCGALGAESAVAMAGRHLTEGAHYLEVGAACGGPGAHAVSEQEEADRVLPVVEALAGAFPQARLMVTTFRSPIAEAALAAGARAIHDVTAMTVDPGMVEVAARHGAQMFLTHLEGPGGHSGRTLARPYYEDVVEEVQAFFAERIATLTGQGMDVDNLVIDVGLGVGKMPAHDYELLAHLKVFSDLGVDQMSGCSRQQFVQALNPTAPPDQRLGGSIVGSLWSVLAGCSYLRVDEVAPYAQMLDVWNAIMARYLRDHPRQSNPAPVPTGVDPGMNRW